MNPGNDSGPVTPDRAAERKAEMTTKNATEDAPAQQAGIPDHRDLQLGEKVLRSRAAGFTLKAAARLHDVDEQTAFAAASRVLVERARWGREVRS